MWCLFLYFAGLISFPVLAYVAIAHAVHQITRLRRPWWEFPWRKRPPRL